MKRISIWMLAAILTISGATMLTGCRMHKGSGTMCTKIVGILVSCISFVAKNCKKCIIIARIMRLVYYNMTYFVYICSRIAKEQIQSNIYAHYNSKNTIASLHRGIV